METQWKLFDQMALHGAFSQTSLSIITQPPAIPSRAWLHVGVRLTINNLASPSRMVYGPPLIPCGRTDGSIVPGHLQRVLCFLEEQTQIHPSHQSYYQTPREHLLYTFLSNMLSRKIAINQYMLWLSNIQILIFFSLLSSACSIELDTKAARIPEVWWQPTLKMASWRICPT